MPQDGESGAQLTNGGLTLSFVWQTDRYTQSVANGVDQFRAIDHHDGVETPVFTDLHRQGELLFVSGMSGDRHWSASIEPTTGGFLFDLACRAKSAANVLGVAYEGIGVAVVADDATPEAPTDVNAANGVHVVASAAETGTLPVTVRMRYRLVAADEANADQQA